jgi:hypothetical protein
MYLCPRLVGDLVDPDPAQPGQRVGGGRLLASYLGDDVPTVRQGMRISAVMVVLEQAAASQATW